MSNIENEIESIIMSHLTYNYVTNIAGIDGMKKDILDLISKRDAKIMQNIRMLYIENESPLKFTNALHEIFEIDKERK